MKKNIKSTLKFALISISAILLAAGLAACSMFQGESIDGNWTSPTGAKVMYEEALKTAGSEEVFTYSDHKLEEIMTKAELNLNVKEDKATFEMLMYVDSDAFFTALKDEQNAAFTEELKKMGFTYESLDPQQKAEVDANRLSDDELRDLVSDSINQMAKELGGEYDTKGGYVKADVFDGDVDRTKETLDITEINDVVAEGLVEKGESYKYTFKDGVLTLKGEKAEDDLVFEKK